MCDPLKKYSVQVKHSKMPCSDNETVIENSLKLGRKPMIVVDTIENIQDLPERERNQWEGKVWILTTETIVFLKNHTELK